MPDHADQAPPRTALLVAERLAEIRDDEQAERPARLVEDLAHDLPAAGASREGVSLVRDPRPVEQAVKAHFRGGEPDQRVRMPPQQFARGAVHEAEPFVAVEGKHRDVDFRQHLIEECVRFQGLESLRAQRRAEPVRLEHDVAERIALAPMTATDRVVAAAQRLEQVRDRAQRLDGRTVHRDCEPDPGADQHDEDEAMHRIRDRRIAQQQECGEQRG